MKEDYCTAKEDMANIIDSNFKIRKKSILNIARLYDDAMPSRNEESDRYISEIIFYYLIWKKFGALSEKSLQRIKRIADTILSLSPNFFQLSSDEYADFMQLTKELHSANISILTDRVGCYWAGTFSLSKNPDFGEEIGVEVLIKDENRQKILKTAEK